MKKNIKTYKTPIGVITIWDNVDEPFSPHEKRGKYKVYKLISPEGRPYFGITNQDVEKRWGKGKKYGFNKELAEDVERFGWENFTHVVMNEDMTKEEALFAESFYILLSGGQAGLVFPDIYNKAKYGTVCEVQDEKTRQQISETLKKYYAEHENAGIRNLEKYNRTVNMKAVRCIDTGTVYESASEAARQTGAGRTSICNVCRGKQNTAGGMKWEYVSREEQTF